MKRLLCSIAGCLLLMAPGAAFANLGPATVTLNNGQTLSLDTGTTGSGSSGDILFTGTGISFQDSAVGANASQLNSSLSGSSGFAQITGSNGQILLQSFQTIFNNTSITGGGLSANTIVVYKTNGQNLGGFLITAVNGSTSVTIQYFTYEAGSGGGTGPTITAVLNNYGLIPPGFSNSGIAQGSLFIIKGSGLASALTVSALESSASPGLPSILNGATVSVTVNGTTTNPAFYYAENVQLALVMPSNTPTGNGTVTVSYNNQTSNAFPITVVASAFGFLSNDGTGTGEIRAVNEATGGFYGLTSSVQPGASIELYGSGLGGDPTRDQMFSQSATSFPFPINALSAVYVGGIQAQIQYQGASGYPGLNQINILIPANAPKGCFVSVVGVTASEVPTNTLTLPIGEGGPCLETDLGLSASVLSGLSSTTNVRVGAVLMTYQQTGNQTPVTEGLASFQEYPSVSYTDSLSFLTAGGCTTSELVSGSAPVVQPTPLNAGTITVNSANSGFSPVQFTALGSFAPGIYATINPGGTSSLPVGFLTQSGGLFPFSATAGVLSPAVGAFNGEIDFPSPLLTWSNESAVGAVSRSAGLTLNWSGGASGTNVMIEGSSSSGSASGSFTCSAPVLPGTFTVPAYVLSVLPAGSGTLTLVNGTVPKAFAAPGLDYAYSFGYVSLENNVTYQ